MILMIQTGNGWLHSTEVNNGCHIGAWNCCCGGWTLPMQKQQILPF